MNPTQRKTVLATLALVGGWPLAAQTTGPAAATSTTAETEEDVVVLSPFEVTADSSTGYTATQTLAGSRINTRLEDVGSAISVVTSEFLRDTGATDNKSLLAYTTNTEVGGTQGNFANANGGQTQDESGKFTSPNGNTRVRGLTSADNTRNFFMSDIPWDSYNVDRIDMQRGANSILFGLGSPAGIINTTTKTAQHRTFGQLEYRYGSYGSNRVSLDYNYNLLPDELSVRVNLLRNDEQYKQDPAYSLDRRIFATLRYDPKFLNRDGRRTSLKVNFENGTIRSNNPRTITPTDCITTWWDELDQSVYNPNTVQNSGSFYNADGTTYFPADAGQYNSTQKDSATGITSTNGRYEPWLSAASFYGGVWARVSEGESTPYSYSMPEYKNIGGLSSAGAVDGSIGGLPFSRRVAVAGTYYWAERNSSAAYQKWGVWKNTTLSDSSVFDFYNNLIDGDNKSEWQNFHNFNATLTQTFFNEKLGFEAAYDNQRYRKGQYSYNGSGTIYVDINAYNIDGTPNENVGKAYIESNYTYGNNSYDITRESARLSAYFNHDFNENGRGGWLRKLLGRHTISTLYSQDMYRQDYRSFKRYGTTDDFADLVSTGTDADPIDSNDRAVSSTVYLSGSLLGTSTYQGLNLSRAGSAVSIPSSVQWTYFDSTWNSTADPSATWISTYNGQTLTQSENPANYVGWTTTSVDILSAENGDQDALTYSATLSKRKVDSRAAVWQAYFWDGAVVGMYGIRHDNVKSWTYDGTRVNNRVNFAAVDANGDLQYSTTGKTYALDRANSPSWSIVTKLNKFFGRYGERLPVKVSLFYNESRNFQVTTARNDIYGNALPAPSGETKDFGVMLSTRDERFTFKINKYRTTVLNATNTTGIPTWFLLGGGNFIQRNEDRADAYQYHLTILGNANSVAETGTTQGTWTWQYAPRTINGVTESQEAADALAASAVAAWRQYTQEPIVQKILQAWGFNDFSGIATTTMSTPVSNFVATEDQLSKGWEYEFTANPTKNWRITLNASETKAMRTNIGGTALREFVELTNYYQTNTAMGDIRQWGGGSISSTSLTSWNSNFYSKYLLMMLQEGTYSSELRRWRVNAITNYNFTEGRLKGFNVGAGYRWQDKIAIGYPVLEDAAGNLTFDIDNPYYGPSEGYVDLWVGYERKLTDKVNWKVQLNVRNVGKGNSLIPVSTQYDGTVATWAIAPCQTWTLTNTFSF
jgi:hypothetical protein